LKRRSSPAASSFVRLALIACAIAPGVEAGAPAQEARLVPGDPVTLQGGRKKWQFLTLTCRTSVHTDEFLHLPGENPFLDHRMTVTFEHASSGARTLVPGFFAADGNAADTGATGGNRWRARFTPDRTGWWFWSVEFRKGPGIAVDPSQRGSAADPAVDGAFGSFHVGPADPAAPGFLARGRLDYVGEHYFRFAETQEPYLKNGAGGPENILAYFELDGTVGDPANSCLASQDHLHRFDAHAADFEGDAVGMAHTWCGGKGVNLLGAIDYLAGQGVNSLYFLTNTYRGDGDDVWPWVTPGDKLHFDVSKLAQWERVFSYMSHRGLQLQLVFEEQENDQLSLGNGGLGLGLTLERRLYYRELVARFAHHHAVIWVIGDESNYYDEVPTMQAMASAIRALDPYRHPLAFHSKHPCSTCPLPIPSVPEQYAPYFGFPDFEATAFQTVPGAYNNSTIQLRAGQAGSRRWAHYGDEQSLNAIPTNLAENRRKALWGNLMGGGAGIAWYPGNAVPAQYPAGVDLCDYFDLTLEDFRVLEDYFRHTRIAVELFRSELPFQEMVADNARAVPSASDDYVFYRPEDGTAGIKAVYAVYRGTGTETELTLGAGEHALEWHDPLTGAGPIAAASVTGPGSVLLSPPVQGSDWLAILRQQ
jgi:hypothetical protein